ncbi:c-type cytochrome [Sandaracinobacteroides sp. A072]|uniref:c-type cytochrome n=1 Tax=Sandaracinobacteroides sp. A072 TaxID=3461146 RepID=UPI004041688D
MDSYEWNKIAGWVLTAAIAVLGLSIITGYLFPTTAPETRAYVVEGVEEEGGAAGPAGAAEQPIAVFLATADLAKGENQFKKCAACHTIDKGGANGIGPNLYGIVGAKHAHIAGFGYSDAMKSTGDKVWDWEGLSAWIANPRKYIPGNKMSFAGMGKPQDRADLIAYLNSKSDAPLPMPAVPVAEETPAEVAPDGEPAAETTDMAAPAA